jgi:hypothetical protein
MRHGVGPDGAAASDEDSLVRAIGRKAMTNLDLSGINRSSKSFLTFPTPQINVNLNNVGVSLVSLLILFRFWLMLLDVWSLIDLNSLLRF